MKASHRESAPGIEALLGKPRGEKYVLRLYIAGATARSERAVSNLKALLDAHLNGRYELTIVDLYQEQERAAENQIVVAPTLIKQLPLPVRRLIGDMADTKRVLLVLDLP